MDILGISDNLSAKSRLSRALTAIFPECEKKRVLSKDKQIYPLDICMMVDACAYAIYYPYSQ